VQVLTTSKDQSPVALIRRFLGLIEKPVDPPLDPFARHSEADDTGIC